MCLDKIDGQWTNCLFTPDESLMFDSDPKTFWHSQRKMEKDLKIIGVQFKVSCLQFLSLKNSFIFSNEMVLYMKDIEHDY